MLSLTLYRQDATTMRLNPNTLSTDLLVTVLVAVLVFLLP